MRPVLRAAAALAVALTLSACGADRDDEAAADIIAAGIGATSTETRQVTEGLARHFVIELTLDDSAPLADQLREVLIAAVTHSDGMDVIEVYARDPEGATIDLEPAYVALGFDAPPERSPEETLVGPESFRFPRSETAATLGLGPA